MRDILQELTRALQEVNAIKKKKKKKQGDFSRPTEIEKA